MTTTELYSFPGGVCPICGNTPLNVELLQSKESGWLNIRWKCPNCGEHEFLRKVRDEGGRNANLSSWAHQVKMRDNNACVICGDTRDLDAHHLIPVAKQPSLRFKLSNGITLCRRCHRLVHDGVKWPEQYKKEIK